MANHAALDEENQRDRSEYWQYYVEGVDRLVWDFLRSYRQRFCNVGSLESLKCEVYDYDADVMCKVKGDEYCGEVNLPIEDTHGERTVKMLDKASKEAGMLTYSMSYTSLPEGARFEGYWQVTMHKASGLPAKDRWTMGNKSDPYVVLTATTRPHPQSGKCDAFVSQQQGAVVKNCLDPEWNETFCIPIASEDGLTAALDARAPRLSACLGDLDRMFPHDDAHADAMSSGWQLWINALNAYVVREGAGAAVGRLALMADVTDLGANKAMDAAKEAVTNPMEFASHVGGAMRYGVGALMQAGQKKMSGS